MQQERNVKRLLTLGAIDLVVAVVAGSLVLYLFAVTGGQDSNPPVCTNRFGNTVDCGQDDWARPAAWAIFGVLLLGLWAFHARQALGSRHD